MAALSQSAVQAQPGPSECSGPIICRLTAMLSQYYGLRRMQGVGITARPAVGNVAGSLQMLDLEIPAPGETGVVIKMAASAMHVDEINAAQGTALGRFYGPKNVSKRNPYILGSSVSGTVVAVGRAVENFGIGDDVVVIPNEQGETSSWATYRRVDQAWVMPKPQALNHIEAAALTLPVCVAWGAVTNVTAGQRCAVVGASGSIGATALQLLKTRGCHVTAVCSGANAAMVRALGADEVIDYTRHDFALAATMRGEKYDVVIDCVGGRDIERRAFAALRSTGRFVTVVGPRRYIGEKRLSWLDVLGTIAYVGGRSLTTRLGPGPTYTFSAKYPRHVVEEALGYAVEYGIRTPVHKVIPFEVAEIATAMRMLASHRARGRIVIDFDTVG